MKLSTVQVVPFPQPAPPDATPSRETSAVAPTMPGAVGLEPEEAAAREAAIRAHARGDGAVRRRVVQITVEAARDWIRAPDEISRVLRAARELSAAERRFVSDAAHELIRHRRRLAFLAGSEDPAALLDAWLADAEDPARAEARLAAVPDPIARLALAVSWPDWLAARFVGAFGPEEARAMAEAMNRRAPLSVRVNRLKGTREELAERLRAAGVATTLSRLAPDGLILHTRQNVYALPLFREGWMELQDEGSQLVAELVAPPPRSIVIDACAGAGGKTLALGAAMHNRGRIVAFDVGRAKLAELRKRVRRAGLTNVQAVQVSHDGAQVIERADAAGDFGGGPPTDAPVADRVLVDAPCSGLGVLRRNPETRWRLQPADLDELPRKQRRLLELYAPLVGKGGRLVYATCSPLPDENDHVIDDFAQAHPEFEPVPAKEFLGRERALAVGDGAVLRLLPHRHDTDGFFGAVLRRKR